MKKSILLLPALFAASCGGSSEAGSRVVLGQRGRTHFFTSEGQHVSSVRYSREAIARKLSLEQWSEAA